MAKAFLWLVRKTSCFLILDNPIDSLHSRIYLLATELRWQNSRFKQSKHLHWEGIQVLYTLCSWKTDRVKNTIKFTLHGLLSLVTVDITFVRLGDIISRNWIYTMTDICFVTQPMCCTWGLWNIGYTSELINTRRLYYASLFGKGMKFEKYEALAIKLERNWPNAPIERDGTGHPWLGCRDYLGYRTLAI